jgi:hypothetical protein
MAMSKTAKVLLIGGAVVLAVFLVAIIGIALLAESLGKPSVPENSVLVLKISGDLPDYAPENADGESVRHRTETIFFQSADAASQSES